MTFIIQFGNFPMISIEPVTNDREALQYATSLAGKEVHPFSFGCS